MKFFSKTLKISLATAVAASIPFFVFAQTTSGCLPNPLKVGSINDLLYLAVDIATYIGVVLAVVFLIYAGFKYITAQGNADKIKEAHHFLLAVVIGIAILIGASAIVNVIENTLTSAGLTSTNTFAVPAGTNATGCTSSGATTATTNTPAAAPAANTNTSAPATNPLDTGAYEGGGGGFGGGGAGN